VEDTGTPHYFYIQITRMMLVTSQDTDNHKLIYNLKYKHKVPTRNKYECQWEMMLSIPFTITKHTHTYM